LPPTVLFDLDGTLIDSIELIQRSKDHAFRKRGRKAPTDEEWLTGIGIPLTAMFQRYATDDADVASFIAGYREYQLANHDRLVRGYDGAVETLSGLRARGHAIGVVTSKSVELSERGLARVGLAHLVDTIVGCDSSVTHKPDPGPVLLALHRLGATPSTAVFIGDSVHDMRAGNAAGVITIGALWGPFTREALAPSDPTYFLERLVELPALLERLDDETGRRGPA
jgi:pyrophosphatase PpaX